MAAHRSGDREAAHHPPPTQPAAEAGPIFPCHQSRCHFTFLLRSPVTCASFSDHSGTEAELTWLGFITLEICQWQIFSWEYCSGDPGRIPALSWGQGKVAADHFGTPMQVAQGDRPQRCRRRFYFSPLTASFPHQPAMSTAH